MQFYINTRSLSSTVNFLIKRLLSSPEWLTLPIPHKRLLHRTPIKRYCPTSPSSRPHSVKPMLVMPTRLLMIQLPKDCLWPVKDKCCQGQYSRKTAGYPYKHWISAVFPVKMDIGRSTLPLLSFLPFVCRRM